MYWKIQENSRAEAVAFLKSLWNEAPQPCPLCNGKLDFLIKKPRRITVIGNALVVGNAMMPSNC